MAINGKVVFASGASADFDIWRLNLDNGELKQLTYGNDFNIFPRWSPDGSKIVYISTQDDQVPSIWVMHANGDRKTKLTSNIYCQFPSWSPDGSSIIFTGNAQDPNEIEVCSIALDGSPAKRLFKYKGIEETPSYSPDGKKIIFSAQTHGKAGSHPNRDSDIVEYSLAEKEFKVLCTHPAKDYSPVYSPDGSKVAFISHRKEKTAEQYHEKYLKFRELITNGSNMEARNAIRDMRKFESDGDIFIMNSDGSSIKQLTTSSSLDNGVCWSPCGNYLMYTSTPKSNNEIDRLKIIDANSGSNISLSYDRTPLEKEIGAFQVLNRTITQKIIPDFLERLFMSGCFWGEERHPHWID